MSTALFSEESITHALQSGPLRLEALRERLGVPEEGTYGISQMLQRMKKAGTVILLDRARWALTTTRVLTFEVPADKVLAVNEAVAAILADRPASKP